MLSIWTVLYTNELMTANISMMITMATWVLWGSSMSTWENAQRSWSQSTIESKTRWSWQRRIWGRSDDDTWWKSIFWWFIGAKKYTSSDTTYLFQCKELEESYNVSTSDKYSWYRVSNHQWRKIRFCFLRMMKAVSPSSAIFDIVNIQVQNAITWIMRKAINDQEIPTLLLRLGWHTAASTPPSRRRIAYNWYSLKGKRINLDIMEAQSHLFSDFPTVLEGCGQNQPSLNYVLNTLYLYIFYSVWGNKTQLSSTRNQNTRKYLILVHWQKSK